VIPELIAKRRFGCGVLRHFVLKRGKASFEILFIWLLPVTLDEGLAARPGPVRLVV